MKQPQIPFLSAKTMARASEILLKQIDNIGYYLSKYGLSDQFNRHNCIALLVMGDQRIRGELGRLQLKINTQKRRVRKRRIQEKSQ